MSEITTESAAVLIVGAGSTGLSSGECSYAVARSCADHQAEAAASRHTWATNLMQRTQELIFALRFLEPLNYNSGHMRRFMVHPQGKCFGPRITRLQKSRFTDVLLCGQQNLEAATPQTLSTIGVEVEFSTELVELVHNEDGCAATTVQDEITLPPASAISLVATVRLMWRRRLRS